MADQPSNAGIFIVVPYFRYRKDGSITTPHATTTFYDAVQWACDNVKARNETSHPISVYFHDELWSHQLMPPGLQLLRRADMDSNISLHVTGAICEVVPRSGYCCFATIIYHVPYEVKSSSI